MRVGSALCAAGHQRSRRTQDVFKNLRLRIEEHIEEHARGLRVDSLIDDLDHSSRRELVRAEMREMRRESRSKQSVPPRQVAIVEQPRHQQRTVRARRERDRVEDDGDGDSFLRGEGQSVVAEAKLALINSRYSERWPEDSRASGGYYERRSDLIRSPSIDRPWRRR